MTITTWLSQILKQRRRVLVPAIVYHELKRELLRADKPFSIGRLDLFTKTLNRDIPLTDEASGCQPTPGQRLAVKGLLAAEGETRERCDQLTHPAYQKPQLLATAPNQLWSWDITKLLGPATWTYYYLYVILDVFSRYVVGWMVADREGKELARHFIAETCAKQEITRGQLNLHADRGSAMTSKPVAFMLADLGVTKAHSRPPCLRRQSILGKSVQKP